MLYERWAKVADGKRSEFALRDAASGQGWTFGELFQAGERAVVPIQSGMVHPQGHGADFILTLLAGWRERKTAFPLEPGQSAPSIPIPPSWCVHLKFTSATTGASRAVAFTAAQLAADAENIVATMGLRSDWPNLAVISMAHSYGFSNLVLPLLLHGIPLILAPSVLPEMLKNASAGEGGITLAAVPALWRAWHESGSIPANVRLAISAGAPLPLELEHAVFASRGLKIHNFYGSSECGGIAYDACNSPRADDACAGTPMCGVNLSVNDAGCLTVRGGAVAEGYWPEPESTLGAGQFETSDLAELKDGLVLWRGRASDIINVAGRKVSPLTVENALAGNRQVRACLVFGVPALDPGRAEDVVACVVPDGVLTADSLREFLSTRISPWQMPRDWWFVDSLETNRLGKVSRAAWRRKYLERTATARQNQTT